MKVSKALLKKAKSATKNIDGFSGAKFRHYGKTYAVYMEETGFSLYLDDGYAVNMLHILDF